MELCYPSVYSAFTCIADKCSDTCCACWEVVIDEESRARYEALAGPVGDTLRRHLYRDADGDSCLALVNGRCPMLRDDNLCELQRTHGEDALSAVCSRYPRFRYEYGNRLEMGLSLSCPEACRLILETPFVLEKAKNDAPPALNDLDPELYFTVLRGRAIALSLAEDARFTVFERTALLLDFAESLAIDPDPALTAWADPAIRTDRLVLRCPKRRGDFKKLRAVFEDMEPLTARFPKLLTAADTTAPIADETVAQRLLQYYIFKYFLQGAYDGRILQHAQFIAASMLLHGALLAAHPPKDREALIDLVHLFSRETEHSEQNISRFHAFSGKRRQTLFFALLLK